MAFFAGLIATFGLPPYDFPLAGFVAFPVLVWLLDRAHAAQASWRTGFQIGWCFGFGYFVGGLWWLGAAILVDAAAFWWALPLAVLALPAVLAIYFGLACMVAHRFWSANADRILVLALALTVAEFLRAHLFTGFPWNQLGVLAAPNLLLMQSAALWGLHGLTLVAILVFSAPILLLRRQKARLPVLLIAMALLAVHAGFGAWKLAENNPISADAPTVRIVQPNIDQSQKWNPQQANDILNLLMQMTAEGREPNQKSMIVWPESTIPYLVSDESPVISAIAEALGPDDVLLTGAARVTADESGVERYFNAILAVRPDGEIEGRFDKVHLVPFGEYLPFQQALERIGIMQLTQMPGGFSAAPQRGNPALRDYPAFIPLICYEIVFQDEIDRKSNEQFILNVTNDAWYGKTPGPYQHLRHSILTAISFGMPLVRAANTGISVITDSSGRVVSALALGERGVIAAKLPPVAPVTIFSNYGNQPVWFMIATLFAVLLICRRKA